jgi:hypothetical protein
MHGTDEDGNEMVWKKDMLCCKTINQIMTEPLQGKRHRIGLLISPPPWVGVKRAIGVDEDGKGYVEYNPGTFPCSSFWQLPLESKGGRLRYGMQMRTGRSNVRSRSESFTNHFKPEKASLEYSTICIATSQTELNWQGCISEVPETREG